MDANFEIKYREGLARIGSFNTNHGKVQTPTIMPVLDPLKPNQFPIDEIVSIGAEIFITNAYLTYRNDVAKEKSLTQGIHSLVDFNGSIMTDSGAFQLMGYGNVQITNKEVTKFQEDIGVDIGVFLDIPVAMGTYDETKSALDITLERASEHIASRRESNVLWAGPIQGGRYLDLIEKSATEMGSLPFDIHAIGSVVPLLENYEYSTITKMIMTAKKFLPSDRPVHLFGAGHPMVFALAVYLGIDLFDSAAYWLFAKAGRYMSVSGTYHLKDLDYFPCNCKFCSETTPKTIFNSNEINRTLFLARHNLAVSFGELRIIKQAIVEGRLWNLVLQRSSSHPKLAEAVHFLIQTENQNFIEAFSSISYKSKLISHPWAFSDPLLLRYRERVHERFPFSKKAIVLLDEENKSKIPQTCQKIFIHSTFGLVPEEWSSIYPVLQHLTYTSEINNEILEFISKWIKNNLAKFKHIFNLTKYKFDGTQQIGLEELLSRENDTEIKYDKDELTIKGLIKYQFNVNDNVLSTLNNITVEKSKSDRIKDFFIDKVRFATIRATDSIIIPSEAMVKFLHKNLPFPNHRIVVNVEIKEFIKEGKSVFSKFVVTMDSKLRPGDECIIVTPEDELLGFGTLILTAQEMKYFKRGMLLKTRRGIE
jgi:7-cyano-7-deazaguanine tRNA-ribosyltransferase